MTPLHAIFVCVVTFMQPQVPVPYPHITINQQAVDACGAAHGVIGGRPMGCYVNVGQPGTKGLVFLKSDSNYYSAWEFARAVQHARGDFGKVDRFTLRTEAMAAAERCE